MVWYPMDFSCAVFQLRRGFFCHAESESKQVGPEVSLTAVLIS